MKINIVKNNKIIAKYMGGKFSGETKFRMAPQDIWLPKFGVCRWDSIDLGRGKTLQYHKSWDWLIPVIDKITSDDSYKMFKDHTSSIVDDGEIYINTRFIENTYKDVVDFINWYNDK